MIRKSLLWMGLVALLFGSGISRPVQAVSAAHASQSPSNSTPASGLVLVSLLPAINYYSVGPRPVAIATGDLNGDGHSDLVTANVFGNDVSVFLGQGDGTFQAGVPYAAGSVPNDVAVGDFNGDGHLDLAVTNWSPDLDALVSVLLGNGDGTFQAPISYPAQPGAWDVVASDFNGDGHLDLVVSNEVANSVSLFLNRGDGTFQPAVNYGAGNSPEAIALGDVNGDSRLDLIIGNLMSGDVSVLLSNGDGTFQPATNYPVGSWLTSVATGDLNGDGRPDLVVGNLSGNKTANVLLNNGDGTFRPVGSYALNNDAESVSLADMNDDGRTDLVIGTSFGPVEVLLGRGNGAFTVLTNFGAAPEMSPENLVVADLNGDGRPDLAVADWSPESGAVSILLNLTDPSIAALPVQTNSPTPFGQASVFTATVTNGSNFTYNWDFGDGTTGTGAIINHSYSAAGAFITRLTAINGSGNGASTTQVPVMIFDGAQRVHSASLTTSSTPRGAGFRVQTDVAVQDDQGNPVAGVKVAVNTTWPDGRSTTAAQITNSNGHALIVVNGGTGNYTFTVTNANLIGWTYDPSANVQSTVSLTIP